MRTRDGHELELVEPEVGTDMAPRLTIRGTNGQVQLRIQLTPEGPVLQFQALDVELEAKGNLSLRAQTLTLSAQTHLELQSGGTVRHRAATHHEISAGGRASVTGHDVRVVARRGDVGIKANDDVKVDGERIWLNR